MPSRSTDTTIGVDEARERILAAVGPLPATELPLDEALGLTLADEIVSALNLPPFDNSAMDGFAIRASDTESATPDVPAILRVAGTIAAGHSLNTPVG